MQEGGEGEERFPPRRHVAAVLQSFSWSEDSAVAQPRASAAQRRDGDVAIESARPVVQVRRCVWKLNCAPKCVGAAHVRLMHTCAHTLFPAEQPSLPLVHSFGLGRRHRRQPPSDRSAGTR